MNQNSKKQSDEINKLIVDIIDKKIAITNNAFNKVDENANRYLNQSLTHTYYLLSINAASIAFIISLTIHEKMKGLDALILLSLILWIISFLLGLMEVSRTMKIMNSVTYYILGESSKMKEVSDTHKKIIENLGKESGIITRKSLFYYLMGTLCFIIWYLITIFSN